MNYAPIDLSRRLRRIGLLAIFVVLGLLGASLASAQPNAIVVNSTSDVDKKNDGVCTLREAIIAANKGSASSNKPGECKLTANNQDAYTIVLDIPYDPQNPDDRDGQAPDIELDNSDVYIFTLSRTDNGNEDSSTTGDLDIKSDITITSADMAVIEAGPGFSDRIFHVLPEGKLAIDRVMIRGGNAKDDGGGIFVDGGELELSNSTLYDNHAGGSGGALYNNGQATLNYVTVKDNTAAIDTGGIVNAASTISFKLTNSYLDSNSCLGINPADASHNIARNASGCQGAADPTVTSLDPIPDTAGVAPVAFGIPIKTSAAVDAAGATGTSCPALDQVGLNRPQYAACDIGAVELENVNDPPIATDDSATVAEDSGTSSITVLDDDSPGLDDVGQTLYLNDVTDPVNGTSGMGTGDQVTYEPDADYFSPAGSPDSFDYQVCDSGGLCSWGTVTVTVTPVNDPPVPTVDNETTVEDTIGYFDVLSNDSPGPANEGQTVYINDVSVPAHGSAEINGSSIKYTPEANYFGSDSFSYEVCDSGGACVPGVGVTVTISGDNDAPTAVADSATTDEDISVTINVAGNDSDIEGDLIPASVSTSSDPAHGQTSDVGDGTIIYTPDAHFAGQDTFEYEICDSDGACSTALVTVDVAADAYIEVTNVCGDDRAGSLHWAIDVANSDTDTDSIVFDIIDDDCGSDTISLTEELPALMHPVILDGLAVDADASKENGSFTPPFDVPYITLDGGTSIVNGITIEDGADGSSIKNLIINNFSGNGIIVEGSPLPADGNTIEANIISNNGEVGILLGSTSSPADNNDVLHNTIDGNCGSGVFIIGYEASVDLPSSAFEGNRILGNVISNNGNCGSLVIVEGTPADDGVTIPDGQNNEIVDNDFFNNADLPIDLGEDGVTDNDDQDGDDGPNYLQNFPYIWTANEDGIITGMLNSTPYGEFTLHFYSSTSCSPENLQLLDVNSSVFVEGDVALDAVAGDGILLFYTQATPANQLVDGMFVMSTATDPDGNTSEFGPCYPVGDDNITFNRAINVTSSDPILQSLDRLGQSRWYKIAADANSKIKVKLDNPSGTDLDFDLVGYNDLAQAYAELLGEKDLNQLDSEFSTDAFAAAEFNPAYVNPAYVNQADYNPAYVNPAYVNPAYVNAALFSADVYSPAYVNPAYVNPAYVNQADYNPAYVNPAYVNPAYVNPAYVNPAYVNPAYVNGNAYSAAQMSSIIGASGNDGQESEEMTLFTYNNPGFYYVRVRARQGGFDPEVDYEISFAVDGGFCDTISEDFGTPLADRLPGVADNYEAIILVDYERMGLNHPEDPEISTQKAQLVDSLNNLAGLTVPANVNSIHAAIVDVGQDDEVLARNGQADTHYQCAYAKNIVADGIKDIVDRYRSENPTTLKYIIIVGNDDHIPFYRHADQSGLGPEEQYVVPVNALTASYASLEANTFLSQDSYGSAVGVAMKNVAIPVPGLPVGRLVETTQQIENVINAYLLDPDMEPTSAFVSSYDFLIDGGVAVSETLGLADSLPVTTLINNEWMASDLQNVVDNPNGSGRLFDIGYWAGHFSATAALAADYETYYWSADFINSPLDYTGAIIYSAGCHSGYNIVDGHAVENYTPNNVTDPDWPAAMAQKGVTLIAGTGYQYGDTDFVEYSERLYLEFTRALRSGEEGSAVSIGNALVEAKKRYLAETPTMSGIHQKAMLEATIYGLPMNSVIMPGDRYPAPSDTNQLSVVDLNQVSDQPIAPFSDDPSIDTPGEVLGLQFYDLARLESGNYSLTEKEKIFTDITTSDTISVTYLENGPNGILIDAGAPVLPLDSFDTSVTMTDTVTASNLVLRGVGFLGGDYTDFAGKIPLVSAATTESSAIHSNFLSFVFYPQQPWSINRFDAVEGEGGKTVLNITPAQYRTEQFSAEQAATRRQFDNMDLRLFYLPEDFLDGIDTGFNRPDVSAAPYIIRASGQPTDTNKIDFEVEVIVDPSAGMQQVWVSYTTISTPTTGGTPGSWQPFFLTQDDQDSTLWKGTLDLGAGGTPENVRFIASAVSGVGLVTMSNNVGLYYPVGEPSIPTQLAVEHPYPTQGQTGTTVPFTAHLTAAAGDLENLPIIFNIGQDYRLGWTDPTGSVTVNIPLVSSPPGFHEVVISFPGNNEFGPSAAETDDLFEIQSGETALTLDQTVISISSLSPDVPLNATLKQAVGDERPLAELTVTFSIWNLSDDPENDVPLFQKAVITNQQGVARLGLINLPAEDSYKVTARFDGTSTYNATTAGGETILEFNRAPLCTGVYALTLNDKDELWPANGRFHGLKLQGATDPDGDPLTYSFTDIYQDEPLSESFDGSIANGCSEAQVLADRLGNEDGRVYHLSFLVEDGNGGSCTGVARIAVAHDQADLDAIDGGPIVHSFTGDACTP